MNTVITQEWEIYQPTEAEAPEAQTGGQGGDQPPINVALFPYYQPEQPEGGNN